MATGRKLGGFEVLEEIGRGGMGVVYRARQLSLDRIVALKVLPRHNHDERAVARFEREAHAMAQLQHPNVMDVIEVGEQDGVPFFAMQYVEGEGLDEVIRREGGLPAERAVAIAAQVADGLQHAHERGVIHRDIKPSNILIAEGGRAVVTDFGIAKAVERMQQGQSLTQGAIGTPEYMSPEVIRGNPVDGRTDVYSLGVVLYQMVTGRAPFTATTPYRIADRHLREPPAPPSSMGVNCPNWLESIILKALAKEPSERFAAAAEMASALRSSKPVAPPTTEFVRPPPAAIETAFSPTASRGTPQQQSLIVAVAAAGVLLLVAAVVLGSRMGAGGSSGGGGPQEAYSGTDRGGTAQVVVSSGSPPVAEVPSVLGLTQGEAERRLEERGRFLVQYNEPRYDDAYERGRIISQYPEAGTTTEPGDLMTLVVSMGSPPESIQIAPWTSHRLVTSSDLAGEPNWNLTLMRNEIYARHGRAFVTDAIQDYFLQQPWYERDPGYSDGRLSRLEQQNVEIIRDYQVHVFGYTAKHP